MDTPDCPDRRVRKQARRQATKRCQERASRSHLLAAITDLVSKGATYRHATALLGVPERTCRYWRKSACHKAIPLRGRPAQWTSPESRNQVFRFLREVSGPSIGLPALQALFRDLPAVTLADVLRRYRRVWNRRHRVDGVRLSWKVPGSVWAMDFTETTCLIAGQKGLVFTVRDLGSQFHLSWHATRDQTATTVQTILARLFREHGPPLVLKSDNGSGFIAETTLQLLEQAQVAPLFSPPRRPSYNGCLERSNTTMKSYSQSSAEAQGHPLYWSKDDLTQARRLHNETARPWGTTQQTPSESWESRNKISDRERQHFQRRLEAARLTANEELGLDGSAEEQLGSSTRRHRDRIAIEKVLVELDYLEQTPRKRTLPLPKRPNSRERASWPAPTIAPILTVECDVPTSCHPKINPTTATKTLEHFRKDGTMTDVSIQLCQSPIDVPRSTSPRVVKMIFSWLRRPFTQLVSRAKAAKIR